MRRIARIGALLMVASMAVGCTSSASLAPSSTPLVPGQYVTLSNERVDARSKGFMLLFIPFGRTDPANRALEECLEKSGADALIDVSVHVSQFSMIAFTIVWTTVAGIPVDVSN